jgi:hypothetical protein
MSEPERITEEGAAAEAVATSMSLAKEELRWLMCGSPA